MGCNCKGKQEGSDLKFFRLLAQVSKEIAERPKEKILADMSMSSKVQAYARLAQLMQRINNMIGGRLTK